MAYRICSHHLFYLILVLFLFPRKWLHPPRLCVDCYSSKAPKITVLNKFANTVCFVGLQQCLVTQINSSQRLHLTILKHKQIHTPLRKTRTHTHTNTHIHIYTQAYLYIQTIKQKHTHIHKHPHAYTHIHTPGKPNCAHSDVFFCLPFFFFRPISLFLPLIRKQV